MSRIFIQIASYRDPQLIYTVEDLIAQAADADNLSICIAHQFSSDDPFCMDILKYENDSRFNILNIHYSDSKGACWARNQIQQHYKGEEYTLQLDSHHRFVKNWDMKLIDMLTSLQNKGYKKPLITGYLPSFNPNDDPNSRLNEVWKMGFDRFTPEGYIFTRPSSVPNWQNLTEPIPSRFYSAHFAFTLGQFAQEVQHDPEMYFHGEEPSISVRAFTHGYDLFHPHIIIAWHEYTREGQKKHWDDDTSWVTKDKNSYYRYRLLHGMDGLKCTPCAENTLRPYNFGNVRSLADYERYAGVKFNSRGVQQYTLDTQYPPNPVIHYDDDYNESFRHIFKHCIDLYAPNFNKTDYDFWVISFEKLDGTVIQRLDIEREEIYNLINTSKSDNNWIRLWKEYTGEKPDKWIVWPHSEADGWCERVEQIL